MRLCMYTSVFECLCVWMRPCICDCVYEFVYCVYVSVWLYIYECVWVWLWLCECVNMWLCVYVFFDYVYVIMCRCVNMCDCVSMSVCITVYLCIVTQSLLELLQLQGPFGSDVPQNYKIRVQGWIHFWIHWGPQSVDSLRVTLGVRTLQSMESLDLALPRPSQVWLEIQHI